MRNSYRIALSAVVVLALALGLAQVSNPGGGSGNITSVFGRTGVVGAQSGDYTAAQVTNAVANTTTVAGHALSSNVTISVSDLTSGALASGSTATSQTPCDNSTKVATTAYAGAVCNLVETSGSPFTATAQSQTIWNNTASAYVVNLPTPTSNGPQICLGDYQARSSAISFVPGSGVTIYYKGVAGTAGSATGLKSGGAAGDYICVEGTDSTTYEASGPGQGSWTDN